MNYQNASYLLYENYVNVTLRNFCITLLSYIFFLNNFAFLPKLNMYLLSKGLVCNSEKLAPSNIH